MPDNAIMTGARPSGTPVRLFWAAALLIDLGLLLSLSKGTWVLAGLVAAAVSLALVRHPVVLLAYLTAGTPLLAPITRMLDDPAPVVIYGLTLVLVVVLLHGWNAIWEPRRWESFVAVVRSPVWRLSCAFGLLLWLGLRWTESPSYGASKTWLYWITNVVLLSLALMALRRERGETGLPATAPVFLRTLFWLQVGIAGAAVLNWFTRYEPFRDRLSALLLNPIWMARHAGLGILSAILLHQLGLLSRRALVIVLPLFGWVFLQAASRGPTLGLIVVLAFWYLASPQNGRAPTGGTTSLPDAAAAGAPCVPAQIHPGRRWKRLAVVMAAALALAVPALLAVTSSRHAIGQTMSNQIRMWLLRAARRALDEVSLIGLGPGGFAEFLGVTDRRWYPHNLFIEVTIENGWLGLGLLLAFLGATFLAWWRWGRALRARGCDPRETKLRLGVGSLFLFAVLCAQFSGDLPVNEWIWAFAGVIAAWAPGPRK